ncbi:MAG: mitogen-activated protein kinase organizer 1 [Bacillariaceae sp.]|jgi:mitogen-activated protein kinase organizer 1
MTEQHIGMQKMQEKYPKLNVPRVPVCRLSGHDGPVQSVIFTPDGKWALTGGLDHTVKLWNPFRVDPQFVTTNSTKNRTCSAKKISFEEEEGISFQNLPPALNIQTYSQGMTHDINALCCVTTSSSSSSSSSSPETLLVASNKTLVVTDLVTNQMKRRIQNYHTGRINAVAATHSGEAYVTASYDATVAIWDGRSRDTKPIQVLKDAKDSVTNVHVVQNVCEGGSHNNSSGRSSSNGNSNGNGNNISIIRTASVDGFVRTYDLRKGLLQCDDFGSPITSTAHTKDGQCLVVSCLDGTIRLMELETGELLNTYNSHHISGKYGLEVDILADDSTIITGSEDGSCVLYDLVRANSVGTLYGPARRPTCTIKAHPKQSSVVIAASYDNSTVVWSNDASPWQEQTNSQE